VDVEKSTMGRICETRRPKFYVWNDLGPSYNPPRYYSVERCGDILQHCSASCLILTKLLRMPSRRR